jgi:hypothetical protein
LGRHCGGQKEIDVRKDEYESSNGMASDIKAEEGGRKIVESGLESQYGMLGLDTA